MNKGRIRIMFELSRSTKSKSRSLASGNEMINANDRLNPHVKAELTKHLRARANAEARACVGDLPDGECIYSKEEPCHILVYVQPPTSRRMDAPNWYPTVKALLDGLTDMGMFADDNDNVITSITFIPWVKTDNKKYRIILEIREGRLALNHLALNKMEGDNMTENA